MAHRWEKAATYFMQYPVKGVRQVDADGATEIDFGSGQITIYDPDISVPTEIVGQEFADIQYGETTDLVFTTTTISVDPLRYSVTHPLCGTVWPERDEDPETLPPDPSDERTADGPTGGEDGA